VPTLFGCKSTTPSVRPSSVGCLRAFLFEENGSEEELEVGRGELGSRAHERDGLSDVRRQRATAAKRPVREVPDRFGGRERRCSPRAGEDPTGEMIEEIRPDPRELVNDGDVRGLERLPRADPRELEQVRRPDCSRAEHDLAFRQGLVLDSGAPVVEAICDTDRTPAVEEDAGDESVGHDRQVRTP